MLILDLWGISFHAVMVFRLGKNLLFKSIVGRCEELTVLIYITVVRREMAVVCILVLP